MPTINDILELTEAFEGQPIAILSDKCVKVRNRNARCTRCVDACPVPEVLVVDHNEVKIDHHTCSLCGACTTVCPVGALMPLHPDDQELAEDIVAATTSAHTTVIACARMAARHIADPDRFAEVPCLGRIEESLLVDIAAHDQADITLVDGDCSTCRYRLTDLTTSSMVASCNELLDAWGSNVHIQRTSAFPDAVLPDERHRAFDRRRRRAFTDAKDSAKDAALKTAAKQLRLEQEKKSLKDRLKVSGGKLPQFEPTRHHKVLDALDRMGSPEKDTISTRLWGRVEIDANTCNACGMCAVFCPTGALKKVKSPTSKGLMLEFTCSDCVQCDLCSDACFKRCLTVSKEIQTSELMDFEPRIIAIDTETNHSVPSSFLA
ncbi:MAG: 4Fe-4S binding protein [Eggerthellaceae bacterium]|nr:4Fe-4S binding protein [Eggerthellaceae bacterium]MCH4221590.1 4Fe-4S binding protein [Eggerthellaceae bacterium]